jgi:hypothetical protein
MSKKPISVAEFFKDQRMVAVRMGEFTLHSDGQLERGGKKQPAGHIIVSPDRKRITVCDQHGAAVVTDLVEAVVPVYADPEVQRLRDATDRLNSALAVTQKRAEEAEERARVAEARVAELEAMRKGADFSSTDYSAGLPNTQPSGSGEAPGQPS